ncbi:diacylglycerol kinase [Nakamurella panacisegetis]|uniref:Diacylglycerol kinase n=1 Tax=Nakamurella panacisegetis TaxID=1090615 RepID=A0A1H0KDA8_9ACTN|nr:diacylglycerol kinase [Nakamurella panacisegetis]SDO53934.1 diacylglycerol kinase [Nakamurella panacisegetis]
MGLEHVAVLVNPVAGGGRALGEGRRAAARFRAVGVRVELLTGAGPAETADLAAQAVSSGATELVACGGDGIVHLALQTVAGTSCTLGVIPAGTGNDIARSLGIPRKSTDQAVDLILAGPVRTIDLGRAGDRWFGAVVASGFDSRVNDRANRMTWPRGRMRYNLAIIAVLASFRPIQFRIELDDQVIEGPAMLVAVGNGPSYGGGMRICPNASMSDGRLDVTIVSRMSRAKLARLFPSVYRGRHLRYPEVLTYRSRRVEVQAPGVSAYADGELVAPLPLTCVAVPDALRVFAPAMVAPVRG